MATYTKYNVHVKNLCSKVIDAFGSSTGSSADTFRAVIHTDAPVVATDATISDLTQISTSTANGYSALDIEFASTISGSTVTATAAATTSNTKTWTASSGNLGDSTNCRYVSIYDDTPTSPADPLVNYWDYGSKFTVASGNTFSINFGASLWTLA